MPTLLNEAGFKFFFYANEHEPMHVHVIHGDDYVKVELFTLKLSSCYMKPKNLKKVLELVELHQNYFEERWNDYFNQR